MNQFADESCCGKRIKWKDVTVVCVALFFFLGFVVFSLMISGVLCVNGRCLLNGNIFILKDPSIERLSEFKINGSSVYFESHLGYSVTRALQELSSLTIAIPEKIKGVQVWFNGTIDQFISPNANHTNQSSNLTIPNTIRETLPSCLDYKAFYKYGYCFTAIDAKPYSYSECHLLLKVAWWRSSFSLVVSYGQ